ncbi:MAG: transglutaminase-like domain-containing protein [Promethearchaeota archaeon]
MENYLKPTRFMDYEKPIVQQLLIELFPNLTSSLKLLKTTDLPAKSINKEDIKQIAIKLFYFVRDSIKYKIITSFLNRKMLKASEILKSKKGYCVQKAILLTALGRAMGIPSRLHFADIINYKVSKRTQNFMGTNLFVWHGYSEFFINNKWIKLTPAFDKELCKEQNFPIIEFTGENDVILPPYDNQGNKFVEYVKDRGFFEDVPYNQINTALVETYGNHILKLKKTKKN